MNIDKEKKAIETLKAFNGDDEPYYLCYSGGKDSDTIRILAELSGCNFEVHNNHTTVDSPTTVYYIRDVMKQYGEKKEIWTPEGKVYQYGDKGFIHLPKETMWDLIVRKGMPPTRLARYCCAELKEKGGKGRRKVTGVRWAESRNRKNNQGLVTIIGSTNKVIESVKETEAEFTVTNKGGVILNTDNDKSRRAVESCYRTTSTLINPIIDWTDEDVWDFLHHYGCNSNPEYSCGKSRVGCIGCPMSTRQKLELAQYPKYRQAYVTAFDRMLEERKKKGKDDSKGTWVSGEAVMRWWVGDNPLQMTIDDYLKLQEEQNNLMDEYV